MIRLSTEIPEREWAEILELSALYSELQHRIEFNNNPEWLAIAFSSDPLDPKELEMLKAKAESVWVEMKEKEANLLGYGSAAKWGEADKQARALGFSGHQHQLAVEKHGVTK